MTLFRPILVIYLAITLIAWTADRRLHLREPRRTILRSFVRMLALAYSYQVISNLVYPPLPGFPVRLSISLHLFTWYVHIIAMLLALYHATYLKADEQETRKWQPRQTAIRNIALTVLSITFFGNMLWLDSVPFRHLPATVPQLLFVESYYFAGLVFLGRTVGNLFRIGITDRDLGSRVRADFSGLAACFAVLYYLLKSGFALAAVLLQLSPNNYPSFFQGVEQLTLTLMIAVAVAWFMVFLPTVLLVPLAAPFECFRKLYRLFQLRQFLHRLDKSTPGLPLTLLRDLDLALLDCVTQILDLREIELAENHQSQTQQLFTQINSSSDVWDVVESCANISNRLRFANSKG